MLATIIPLHKLHAMKTYGGLYKQCMHS